ncbi:MAG: hypothetical protein HGA98_01185 [Deltaproteobacteria bacterium]|nr:hypothetical protein [Deltaproteobacteria bacterium]
MAPVKGEALGGLVSAATKESLAVSALSEALRDVRASMEGLDTPRLEETITLARRRVDNLALAANSAASLTRLAARAVGAAEGATLAEIGERLDEVEGAELRAAAKTLRQDLEALAVETAAQMIAARYGAALWDHLVGLRGERGGYSSKGQLRPGTGSLVGRA